MKYTQKVVKVDSSKSVPIYRQIIDSVQSAIENGLIRQGDSLPSVNAIAAQFSIARGSIFKGYDELRSAGIINSIPGKGFFVVNDNQTSKRNIFLLMSTFNPYRETFYNAFIGKLKNEAVVDLYFHHHNIEVFETLIQNHAPYYNTFVIMPEINKRTKKILRLFDDRNMFILDTGHKDFGQRFPGVSQNYEQDIITFLSSNATRLGKYNRTVLLFSENMRNYEVINGFEHFFEGTKLQSTVINDTLSYIPSQKDLCIIMDDNDLVRVVLYAQENGWKLGKDIGIISYHDTPLKQIIAEGITAISPDFKTMGESMAELILENRKDHIQNPFLFIERQSF